MADFNEMLQNVMSNPQAIQQIMSLAQSLGLQGQGGQDSSSLFPSPQPEPKAPQPDPTQLFQGLLQLSRQTGDDSRQLALFKALKPFLRPDRAAKLDWALQVAKISRIAGSAFQSMGPQFFSGR